MTSEHEDFEALLIHPGYLRLVEFARKNWKDGLDRHIAIAADERDDKIAVDKIRQVVAATKAVEHLLAYPGERLKDLDAKKQAEHAPPSMSRRGGL